MTDPNGWRPTAAQRQLLFLIGEVLDKQAGDGLGSTIEDGSTVWIDDLVGRIVDTFELNDGIPLDFSLRERFPSTPPVSGPEGEGCK